MSKYSTYLKKISDNEILGHEHLENSKAILMGVENKINSDGLRDKEYQVQKTKRRIIFLGDSLTFGWGVAKENIFETILERELNQQGKDIEILNFGIGNYNTLREVELFKKKGLKYNPDEVVIFFFINDAEVLNTANKKSIFQKSQLLTLFWSKIKSLKLKKKNLNFKEYYRNQFKGKGWEDITHSLRELVQISKENEFKLKLVILPELHNLKDYPFFPEHKMVMELANRLEIPAIDLTDNFNKEVDPMVYWVAPDDAHPNDKAHRIIADSIIEFIEE